MGFLWTVSSRKLKIEIFGKFHHYEICYITRVTNRKKNQKTYSKERREFLLDLPSLCFSHRTTNNGVRDLTSYGLFHYFRDILFIIED